jgi:hypothetical protein
MGENGIHQESAQGTECIVTTVIIDARVGLTAP